MTKYFLYSSLLLVLILLVACSNEKEDQDSTLVPIQPSPTLDQGPTLDLDHRLELENYQTQLRQIEGELSTIWESLLANGTSQCGQSFNIPSQGTFDTTDLIEQDLGQAASNLRQAADLWASECQLGRSIVPSDVIQQGILWVRAAADALSRVEQALSS